MSVEAKADGLESSLLDDALKLRIAKLSLNASYDGGSIYYIACPETNRVKIGFTKSSPEARLKALQTGSPTRLRLMALHPGTMEDERYLHGEFHDARAHGEWFDITEQLFELMGYACWAESLRRCFKGQQIPRWALLGLDAFGLDEEYVREYASEALKAVGRTQ